MTFGLVGAGGLIALIGPNLTIACLLLISLVIVVLLYSESPAIEPTTSLNNDPNAGDEAS